jgi:two-component system cell cycle response regulator
MSTASGLLAGADDYVYDLEREMEFRARIRVQLRNKRYYDALHRVRNERDSLKRDARIDPLTEVFNRRALEVAVADRTSVEERFGVLFIDIDRFKPINDTFGHDKGDEVLREAAKMLKAGIRPGDVLARYGGEEFVVLVAGAGPESARVVGERLRVSIEGMPPFSAGPKQVTVSIGATVFDPRVCPEGPLELLKRADKALYAAKNAGRNQVVCLMPDEETVQ